MSRKNKKNDEENGAPEDGHNDLMTVRIGASAGENKAAGEFFSAKPADSEKIFLRYDRAEVAETRRPVEFDKAVLFNMNEGLLTVDQNGSVVTMNPAAEKQLGWRIDELHGRNIHEAIHYKRKDETIYPPEECPTLNVLRTGVPVFDKDDVFIRKDGTFFDARFSASPLVGSGQALGLVIVFRDVTERKRTQEISEFLLVIAEKIRTSRNAQDLLADVSELLGKYLGAHRCLFNEIDLEKDLETVHKDYSRTGESVAGKHKISDYSPIASANMKAGQTVVNRDSETDPRTADLFAKIYAPNKEFSYVAVPMLREGKWVASLWCSDDKPRDWSDEEIGLLEQIAERAWSAVERIRAEGAIAKLAAIVEFSDDAIISKDLDGTITSWNRGAVRLFGYAPKEAIGKSITMLIPPDRYDEEPGILNRIRAGESIDHYETVRRRKDGRLIDISLTVSPVYDSSGRIIAASKVARDISARKRAEKALRASQTRLADELLDTKILQKLSIELISEQRAEKLYEQILEAAMELMKADFASIQLLDEERNALRLLAWKNFHEDSAASWQWIDADSATTCGRALATGGRIVLDDIETNDGLADDRNLEEYRRSGIRAMQSTPLTSRSGRPLGMISTHWGKSHRPSGHDFNLFDVLARQAADLIERSRAEAALRDREERLRLSLDASQMGSFIWYVDDDRTEDDARMLELFGLAREDELNLTKALSTLIHPDDRVHYTESVEGAIDPEGDGRLRDDIRIIRADDGEERCIAITGQAEFEGEPRRAVRVAGVAADITEARRAEAALRESEEKYRISENQLRLVTDNIPALIAYVGADERYKFVNGTYSEWFGQPKEAFLGKKMQTVVGVRAYKSLKSHIDQVLTGESTTFELLLNYKMGPSRFVSGAYVPDLDEDGSVLGFYALTNDITELKRSEEMLFSSQERMRLLTESFTDYAIFSTDVEGRVDTWNPGAENIFGYKDDEILGTSHEVLFTPEDVGRGVPVKEMRNARNNGRASDERWLVRKDGSRFFASGVMAPLFLGASLTGYAKIAVDLTERKRTAEALQRAHDEMEVRVLERTKELAEANAALISEINERKTAERERVELLQRLVTTQEDERRRIARDIHDQLGQRLTALRLKIASLKELCADNEVLRARATRLQEIGEVLDSEVSFLAWELRPTALDELGLKDAIGTFVHEWSLHYDTSADFHSIGMANIRLGGDADTHLYRIAQEALNNIAKHAKAKRVNVLLEKREEEVVLILEDDGVGFVRHQEQEVKKGGKGLGLRGMGERASLIGGTLEIESAPGQGTTIYASIPINGKLK